MAMSSLSIYKDLHDYLNYVVIDQFTAAGENQLSCGSEQEIGQCIKGKL